MKPSEVFEGENSGLRKAFNEAVGRGETYTEKRLEKELSKLVIDLVWSATDGGCKITESNFSHFGEPIPEWTALVSKLSTSIQQALVEERERVRGIIEKKKKTEDEVDDNDEGERYYNEALDDLLSSLDKPLTDKDI